MYFSGIHRSITLAQFPLFRHLLDRFPAMNLGVYKSSEVPHGYKGTHKKEVEDETIISSSVCLGILLYSVQLLVFKEKMPGTTLKPIFHQKLCGGTKRRQST